MIVTNKALGESGKATRFIKGQRKANAKNWRYTQARNSGGRYIEVYSPDHPNRTKAGYVREHRLIVEGLIGRLLTKDEVVHHVDGNTLNNDVNNLQLMMSADHRREHTKDNIHKRWN